MQLLNDKVDGSGGPENILPAAEWNQLPTELQNIITALGMTLSNGDLNQLGKALAGYVANGAFYTDSGVADAYVLTPLNGKQSPPSYTDGMIVEFIAGNPCTGAATVNVAGLGVKDIRQPLGVVIQQFDIIERTFLRYDLVNDWFELVKVGAPSQFKEELAYLNATETFTNVDGLSGFEILADRWYKLEATIGIYSEDETEGISIRFSGGTMTRIQVSLADRIGVGTPVPSVRQLGSNETLTFDNLATNTAQLTMSGFFKTETGFTLDFQAAKAGPVATSVQISHSVMLITDVGPATFL